MTKTATTTTTEGRDLIVTRVIDTTPEKVFRAWTEPELLRQWFAPKPWTTPHVETDVRAGGSTLVVMRGPDGTDFPNRGVYLEVVKNERLVFTDAFISAWEPSPKPFMTVILTFENLGALCRCQVRHGSSRSLSARSAVSVWSAAASNRSTAANATVYTSSGSP